MKRQTLSFACMVARSSSSMPPSDDGWAETGHPTGIGTSIPNQHTTDSRLCHFDGLNLRKASACKTPHYYFDSTKSRQRDSSGASVYFFDGTLVHAVDILGARSLFRDGPKRRAFAHFGAPFLEFEGVRLPGRYGGPAFFALFEHASTNQAAVGVLEAYGLPTS